jgi:hypothetical protein
MSMMRMQAWALNFWRILNKSGSDEVKEDKIIISSMSLFMKATIPGTHGISREQCHFIRHRVDDFEILKLICLKEK